MFLIGRSGRDFVLPQKHRVRGPSVVVNPLFKLLPFQIRFSSGWRQKHIREENASHKVYAGAPPLLTHNVTAIAPVESSGNPSSRVTAWLTMGCPDFGYTRAPQRRDEKIFPFYLFTAVPRD